MSETVQIKTPWLASKDPEVPSTLNYSTLSMCGRVEEMVRQYPNYIAYEFMGKTTTYAEMWQKINACAKSLKAIDSVISVNPDLRSKGDAPKERQYPIFVTLVAAG